MKYVFLVTFDWSTDDERGIDTFIYADYHKGKDMLRELISAELNPELSWVGDEAFNEDTELNEGYQLNTNYHDHDAVDSNFNNLDNENFKDLYWEVYNTNDSQYYSCISLKRKEIL